MAANQLWFHSKMVLARRKSFHQLARVASMYIRTLQTNKQTRILSQPNANHQQNLHLEQSEDHPSAKTSSSYDLVAMYRKVVNVSQASSSRSTSNSRNPITIEELWITSSSHQLLKEVLTWLGRVLKLDHAQQKQGIANSWSIRDTMRNLRIRMKNKVSAIIMKILISSCSEIQSPKSNELNQGNNSIQTIDQQQQ